MQQKGLLLTLFIFTAILTSCVTAKQKTNDELFTPSYISSRGYGKSAEASKSAALSELSRYFSSKISVKSVGKTLAVDGESHEKVEEVAQVLSDTKLFAVHYTKSEYNKNTKQYESVAYIEREEAWKIFEPKLKEKLKRFYNLYSEAAKETEPFLQLKLFNEAKKFREEALKLLQFAYALSPDKASLYSREEEALTKLDSDITLVKEQCTLCVKYNSTSKPLEGSVEKLLSKKGFILTDKKPRYICTVSITENKTENAAGIFFSPSVTITITQTAEGAPLFSWSNTFRRMGASNESVAHERMYREIRNSMNEILDEE